MGKCQKEIENSKKIGHGPEQVHRFIKIRDFKIVSIQKEQSLKSIDLFICLFKLILE